MFVDTTTKLAREAEVTPALIRLYASLGLLEHVRASNGTRLFASGQAQKVRAIYLERVARKGRKSA
jgi:DNA-binding transcriptional MerR regulator